MALSQINQSFSSMADLISKLNTFLSTAGAGNPAWVSDAHVPGSGEWALSKDAGSDTVEVAFQWDTASPNALGIYQYHTGNGEGAGYNTGGGTNPTDQDGDSGNGFAGGSLTDANLLTSRHADLQNNAGTYWCFCDEGAVPYAHIVVKLNNGIDYVHFGFGYAQKVNDWTGGEYAYGQFFDNTPISGGSSHLWDGLLNGSPPGPNKELMAATMRVQGMTDTPTNGIWAVLMGAQAAAELGDDRQGTPVGRIHMRGGFRASSHAAYFGGFAGTINQGFIPTYPIVAYHYDRNVSGTSTQVTSITPPMAVMKDVRGVHMKSFQPEDTVTIGSDTWYIFPSRRWSNTSTSSTSGVQGIMYKAN